MDVETNYHCDVVKIVDANGNSMASYSYDPWGVVQQATENSAIAGQPIRYAGYVYDTETKFYYLQARYYDPETARFISRDPDGGDKDNPLSQNLYAYANDDPVNNVDPDGEWAWAASLFFVPGIGQGLAIGTLAVVAVGVTAYAAYSGYRLYRASKKGKKARDAGKGEAHGDNGRALEKAEKQIEKLMEELKTATGKAGKRIRKKIQNIREADRDAAKGKTHWRR